VPDVTARTLRKALTADVDMPSTVLHTDGAPAYVVVAPAMAGHESVDHKAGEYVRNGVTTNMAETFFSQLKRSVDGTHHHVSAKHLPRYLAEFDYRFSTRKLSDSARMSDLIGRTAGRRLTYRPVEQ
jgi:ISXO2-like transposase domain